MTLQGEGPPEVQICVKYDFQFSTKKDNEFLVGTKDSQCITFLEFS